MVLLLYRSDSRLIAIVTLALITFGKCSGSLMYVRSRAQTAQRTMALPLLPGILQHD
jgi:hypothetical protein